MNDAETRTPEGCRFEEDIPAYLQGELAPGARAAFERHAAACPSCARDLDAYRSLLQDLRTLPEDAPARDLAPAILARLSTEGESASERFRHLIYSPQFLRAAALVIGLGVAGVLVALTHPRTNSTAASAQAHPCIGPALDWLKATQESDGHWDTAKWGAQKNYAPGITALAILAFLKQDGAALNGPNGETIRRGLDYLMNQQTREGRIGAVHSGTPYNQGLTTLALLEACARENDTRWRNVADRALAYIQSSQLASGGWGYPRTPGDSGNTSVTVWQLQALLKAESMGRHDLRGNIDRGMAWLTGVVGANGRVGYTRPDDFPNGHETLTAAGALCFLTDKAASAPSPQLLQIVQALREAASRTSDVDYYRFYFMTQALLASGGNDLDLAGKLREALAACQAQDGPHAGSFETSDRWSSAGGRVYATAMAVLAL